MLNKLIIGTANFGLEYGIANNRKLTEKQIKEIFLTAKKYKIWGFDTARGYGNAEALIGRYNNYSLSIITKLPNKRYIKEADVIGEVKSSLKTLKSKKIEILLIHSFINYKKDKQIIISGINRVIKLGLVKQWGVSVYNVDEVNKVLKDGYTNFVIEFPANLFDRRFLSSHFLSSLKNKGCMLIARSILLQGLFVLGSNNLKGNLNTIKSKLKYLQDLSNVHKIPIPAIALLFIINNKYIDKIVIGVDSPEQLMQNILALGYQNEYKVIAGKLDKLQVNDNNILLPNKWKLN